MAKATATATKAAPQKATSAKAQPSKALARQAPPKPTAVAELDDELLSDLSQDAGAGLERATQQDYALPFVYLLQKMSPQVDPDSPKHIEGAKPGMFLNSMTQELFEELKVIPIEFEKKYIEWVKRDAGGGFIAAYDTRADAEQNLTDAENHQIVDTANHYVLVENNDGEWQPAILSLTSTKLKASRRWVSTMGMVTIPGPNNSRLRAPTYAKFYMVRPDGPITNVKGTYFILKVEAIEGEDGWVKDKNLREMAKNFRASLQAGTRGADFTQAAEVAEVEVIDEGEPKY